MKKSKKFGILIASFLAFLLLAMAVLFFRMGKEVGELTFQEVSLDEIEDGTYWGSAVTTLVEVDVEVDVKDHKITAIRLIRHDNGLGSSAEAITEEMLKQNTYDVDAVSGATVSSQVIKSAVSNALGEGKE